MPLQERATLRVVETTLRIAPTTRTGLRDENQAEQTPRNGYRGAP